MLVRPTCIWQQQQQQRPQMPMLALGIVDTLELHPPLYPYTNIQPHTDIHAFIIIIIIKLPN
jgi:hypothetical protein